MACIIGYRIFFDEIEREKSEFFFLTFFLFLLARIQSDIICTDRTIDDVCTHSGRTYRDKKKDVYVYFRAKKRTN